jgi:hypothetical protein
MDLFDRAVARSLIANIVRELTTAVEVRGSIRRALEPELDEGEAA